MESRLKVYYGWARLNKVRKKISLSVMFENSATECRNERGRRTLTAMQHTCCERYQSKEEMEDAVRNSRIFTEYDLMFDDKAVNGSLNRILEINSQLDRKNVSPSESKRISDALRVAFMADHPDYREPTGQLELNFEGL